MFKKILLIVLVVLFIASLSLNYYFYKKYQPTPNSSDDNATQISTQNSNAVMGQVISVDNNKIKVNDGQKDVEIKINNQTTYSKNYVDPIEARVGEAKLSDIKDGMQAEIIYDSEAKGNNLVAKKINILANNMIVGNVKLIDSGKIVIENQLDGKTYEIVLNDKTAYYKQIVSQFVPSSDSKNPPETKKPEQIIFNDIKTGVQANVFLIDSVDTTPQVANKIIMVEYNK